MDISRLEVVEVICNFVFSSGSHYQLPKWGATVPSE